MTVCANHGRAGPIGRIGPRSIVIVCLASVLAGCGGGGGGGVDIAGGQGPDPVVLDVEVAYVRRPVPVDDQGVLLTSDVRQLPEFELETVGADLWVRDRAAPSAPDRNITESVTQSLADIRDLDVSFDGAKIAFAMRTPFMEGVPDEDQVTWNIWEYDIENDLLRRIVASDITAEAGHDMAPNYLPDGRIVFTSTRQRQSSAMLLDEGKPQFPALDENFNEPAFVLHVMNDDGTDIRQISYNQSHDFDPVVLDNGQIAFSRWDNAGFVNEINLYRMNPDGSDLELLYGAESHDPGAGAAPLQFLQPREMPDGSLLTLLRGFVSADPGGDLISIETPNYVNDTQPTQDNIGVLSGPAQTALTVNNVQLGQISPGGYFSAAFPLNDGTNRMLVSWSPCRLLELTAIVPCTPARLADPAAVPAPPLYGIWIYDMTDDTQLPVLAPVEGIVYTDIVAAEMRALPPVLFDGADTGAFDPALVAEGTGLLNIRSVYDLDGADTALPDIETVADPAQTLAANRPARFLRVVKAVGIPDDDVLDFSGTAFGASAAQGMREILGYVPVEPDGSVVVKVPANVPLAISVLDANGRRITPRHQNWLQVRPGQELRCNGCHAPASGVSHGRSDAFAAVYAGATTTAQPFPNTDPAIFADFGETMAEARARISCATDCAAMTPRVDVVFDDIWTDEIAAGRVKDPAIDYCYADTEPGCTAGLDTPPPVIGACISAWGPLCRIIVNYETHIHPLWSLPRLILAGDGVTVLEDRTCITCHSPTDAMAMVQVPAGQLDLTDGPAPQEPDHFNAYRELLFADDEQEVDMGALQDVLVQVGVDPVTGDPIFVTINVPASLSTAGANASPAFFSRFDAGGTHAGYLSGAELRLIAEWTDIGAQYFNNPFDVPIN